MTDDYTLDKLLSKIKKTDIEKLDDIRLFIGTGDKMSDDITLKNALILII